MASSSSVCDASVPAARAKSIDYWAAKNTKHPPHGELADFFELRCEGSMATHAVAKRRFQNGDLILREAALIRIPDASQQRKQRLSQRYGQRAPFLFPGVAVDWEKVKPDVKEAILTLFWCHPLLESASSMLAESYEACCDLLSSDTSLARCWEAQDLIRYLHIVDLNIHKDDEEKGHADFSGLFVLGSKFSHSCAPNCMWSFSKDGCLTYRAVRAINPGDLLTFSYIGNGMNMVTDTISRQRRLGSLWFICLCSRCQQPDLSRQLRCPKCRAPRCIPCDAKENLEWSCEKSIDVMIPEVKVWRCAACSGTFKSREMPLDHEERLSRAVPEVMQGYRREIEEDAAHALELRRSADCELGPSHWTWMLVTFAWLQKCLIMLNSSSTIDFSERDVREASAGVARWFADFAPANVEQRMPALSLTLKLMENLGGSLEDWGYDPGNPVGDDLPISFFAEKLGISKEMLSGMRSEEDKRSERGGETQAAKAERLPKEGDARYQGRWK